MTTKHSLLCQQIHQYLQIKSKTNKLIHTHVPTEGRLPVHYRAKQAKEGVLFGITDFVIMRDALFVEVKTGKDRLNDNQKEFFRGAYEKGHAPYVIRSFDEFLELFEQYTQYIAKTNHREGFKNGE
jgi:ABC-type uncharacterized transport system involved in gliding motility auxiliary subunit